MAWIESGVRALSEVDLSGEEMLRVVMLINSYVRGAAQLTVDAARSAERSGGSADQRSSTYAALFARVAADDRYPTLAGLVASGIFDRRPDDAEHGEGFAFGLQRLLDGIEAL